MKIRKRTMVRLASISALGAGGLGVAAGTAEAGIVYTPLDGQVGVNCCVYNSTFSTGVPFAALQFKTNGRGLSTATTARQSIRLLASGPLKFKLGEAAYGQTWNELGGGSVGSQVLAFRSWRYQPGHTTVSGSFIPGRTLYAFGGEGNYYKLFKFTDNGQTDYGWVQLSVAVRDLYGPDARVGGIAYDDSGNVIPAGAESSSTTPEPGTMALTGIAAALILGATGVRRWRRAAPTKTGQF